jgi:hypothetical protein
MNPDPMEPLLKHTDLLHCLNMHREPEKYGDVMLSVQANWGAYCKLADQFIPPDLAEHWRPGQLGCAHIPLEHYDTVEIALWWVDVKVEETIGPIDLDDFHMDATTYVTNKWISKPSEELGIEGFDDLWDGDVVAGFVPLRRVGELQVALMMRAHRPVAK